MRRNFAWLLLLFPLLQACPPVNTNRLGKKLRENNMNFPAWEKKAWQGNTYIVPKDFDTENDINYISISEENVKYDNWEIRISLLLEEFDMNDAEHFQYIVDGNSKLESVHQAYVDTRSKNGGYRKFSVSQRKKLKLKYQNYSTVVIENFVREYSYDDESNVTCFITTLKKKDKFYVIQLSGRADKMNYLYDDYLKIVKSFK